MPSPRTRWSAAAAMAGRAVLVGGAANGSRGRRPPLAEEERSRQRLARRYAPQLLPGALQQLAVVRPVAVRLEKPRDVPLSLARDRRLGQPAVEDGARLVDRDESAPARRVVKRDEQVAEARLDVLDEGRQPLHRAGHALRLEQPREQR